MRDAATSDSLGLEIVEIRLTRLQQLFNSLDPSPFHERDLDQDAEEYIVDSVDEFPLPRPVKLVIHLPADQLLPTGHEPDLAQALHNYFSYRLGECQRRLRFYFRDGRMSLAVGVAFLLTCTLLRQVALAWGPGVVSEIAGEGLLIVGWVAMWRPLEIFLYDWRPIKRRCRLLAKLSEIPVTVRTS